MSAYVGPAKEDYPVEPVTSVAQLQPSDMADISHDDFEIRKVYKADRHPGTKVSTVTLEQVQLRQLQEAIQKGEVKVVPLPVIDVNQLSEPSAKDEAIAAVYNSHVSDEQVAAKPIRAPRKLLKSQEAIPKVMLNRPPLTDAITIEHEQFHEPQDLCLPHKCPFCFEEDLVRKQKEEAKSQRVEEEHQGPAKQVNTTFKGQQICMGYFKGVDADLVRALVYHYLGVTFRRMDRFKNGVPAEYEKDVARLKPIVKQVLKEKGLLNE